MSSADPVYAPNSTGGPRVEGERYLAVEIWKASEEFIRPAYTLRKADDDDFGRAGTMVHKVRDDARRNRVLRH